MTKKRDLVLSCIQPELLNMKLKDIQELVKKNEAEGKLEISNSNGMIYINPY